MTERKKEVREGLQSFKWAGTCNVSPLNPLACRPPLELGCLLLAWAAKDSPSPDFIRLIYSNKRLFCAVPKP